mgnify:CR=1 FL=1
MLNPLKVNCARIRLTLNLPNRNDHVGGGAEDEMVRRRGTTVLQGHERLLKFEMRNRPVKVLLYRLLPSLV